MLIGAPVQVFLFTALDYTYSSVHMDLSRQALSLLDKKRGCATNQLGDKNTGYITIISAKMSKDSCVTLKTNSFNLAYDIMNSCLQFNFVVMTTQ